MTNTLVDGFYCPITGDLMIDPVIDREGNSYERSAIEDWIRIKQISPITRNPLYLEHLTPNRALKDAITDAISRGVSLPATRSQGPRFTLDREPEPEQGVRVNAKLFPIDSSDSEMYLHLSILATERKERIPSDIVVVIDTSGSMTTTATAQGVENVNLTMLDIVKHAVKTIIHTLNSRDRLAIVKFSTGASIVSPLLPMTDLNKRSIEHLLEPLRPDGGTNIWDGVKTALDLLKNDRAAASMVSNSSILLLTDGMPTTNPPRGNLPMLQRYGEANGNKYPGILSTFGFGYSLDSSLLAGFADMGGGMYAFIPDSGFVGTAFVHALANTLVTVSDDAIIELEANNGCFSNDPTIHEEKHVHIGNQKVVINLGSLQSGQSIDIIKRIRLDSRPAEGVQLIECSLSYTPNNQLKSEERSKVNISCGLEGSSPLDINDHYELAAQLFRLKLVSTLKEVMAIFERGAPATNQFTTSSTPVVDIDQFLTTSRPLIVALRENIESWLVANPETPSDDTLAKASAARSYIQNLLIDISGQITEAMSRSDWFNRWGRHYLPSLSRAHELQQCNNFKDPGIQQYGGKTFAAVRDFADDAFGNLPPPTAYNPPRPTNEIYRSRNSSQILQTTAAPVSMSMFNDRYGGCIYGKCKALLADGHSTRDIDMLKSGDILFGNVVIECVLRSPTCNGKMTFVQFNDGLIITPWHPVHMDGQWTFPRDMESVTVTLPCDYVYSFLLRYEGNSVDLITNKRPVSMIVNGLECICLGHGIERDPVATHEFFGSEEIIKVLQANEGWEYGLVTNNFGYRRDPVSGRIIGMLYE